MPRLQSEVAIDAGSSETLRATSSIWGRPSGKLLITAWLFVTAVAWCVLRSHFDNWGKHDAGDTAVPISLRAILALAFLTPALLMSVRGTRLAWLTGLSVSLGTLPSLPFFPYLRDYTHLVMFVWLLASVRSLFHRVSLQRIPLFVLMFWSYIAICSISAAANFAIFHSIWQVKVGISYLILFGAFGAMMSALTAEPEQAEARIDNLLDGFIWGVGGQVVLALVVIPLIFAIPYSEGNDTIFGFSYYDRYKSTFSGPVAASMLFIVSVPFLFLWAHRRNLNLFAPFQSRPKVLGFWLASAYLQLMPWLVMATGSRTARVAFVGTFLVLLVIKKTRGAMLAMLPSTAVAYFVAFYYQSLPAAVERLFTPDANPSMNLSDRFFAVPDRVQFAGETVSAMMGAPGWVKLVGFGPGTGGYRLSGFPEPHNFLMNQWAETGLLGVATLVAFFTAITWGIMKHVIARQGRQFPSLLLLLALISFSAANLTYNPAYWGISMYMALIMSAAVAWPGDRRPAQRLTARADGRA
jgi:hypothetical protein